MEGRRGGVGAGPWWLSPEFVDSEEFTVAFLSVLTFVCLAIPLALTCYRHVVAGHVTLGCSLGVLGAAVAGVSGWKLLSSVRRARTVLDGLRSADIVDT